MENELLQRPAGYWLKKAEKLKQNGELIRAALLERHASRAHPQSDAACMNYAFTLRLLNCYEASNREAFAALAANPARQSLWGLIGLNMLSIGQLQGGLDALNLYLESNPTDYLEPWCEQAVDAAYAYDDSDRPPRRRRARLDGLMQIAAHRLSAGDGEAAHRALTRASTGSYHAPSARRELLWALHSLRSGDRDACAGHLARVMELSPRNAQNAASAAGIYQAMGQRTAAIAALTTAAMYACSPEDELAVCLTSRQLNAEPIALGMLKRALRHQADRYPVCYNLCVCLLHMGRLAQAEPYIHLCRELDPDDIQGEILFGRVVRMSERGLSADEVQKAAKDCSYWGSFTPSELAACAAPVLEMLSAGPESAAQTLQNDVGLRNRVMYLLSLPLDWVGKLLLMLGSTLSREKLEPMLREVLLTPSAAPYTCRCAAAMLAQLGVEPPFPSWSGGRLGMVDPTRPPESAPSFRQRMLTRRIHEAQKLCPEDHGLSLWAVEKITRLPKVHRRSLIADAMDAWPAALAVAYCAHKGITPPNIRWRGRLFAAALNAALRALRQTR